MLPTSRTIKTVNFMVCKLDLNYKQKPTQTMCMVRLTLSIKNWNIHTFDSNAIASLLSIWAKHMHKIVQYSNF